MLPASRLEPCESPSDPADIRVSEQSAHEDPIKTHFDPGDFFDYSFGKVTHRSATPKPVTSGRNFHVAYDDPGIVSCESKSVSTSNGVSPSRRITNRLGL